ncbi:ABC transporter ATP-binding protein [Peribacillus tepidiphilus]|uniref:ABC transporter ATP-binding protein n=1 Tax=Peribacillus tepidiphilus TaxID=2652445 RepID=UPI0035B5041F
MKLIEVEIDSAWYEDKKVLSQITFQINHGELVGVIGPNGAGKSTTIKTILGLMNNWKGTITFSNPASYSYVPERPIFYDELTLQEHIDFIGAVEGIEESELKKRADYLLQKYKMEAHVHELPATYSKGMQQKAMLILALLTQPHLFIIDEPFIGLDPDAMKILLATIDAERKRGAGILMSTHVLDTAEKICDRFLLIVKGRLVAQGTMEGIRKQAGLAYGSLYDCYHTIAEDKVYE